MQAAERSQLRRLLSSDDFNRRRGVAMSITVSITDVQSHTPDVDADEMSNSRRPFTVLITISVGADPPCCRKLHGSLRSFSLTGTIFLSIPSLFACIQSSRSQYFTSTNHLSSGFYLNFLLKAYFKSLHALRPPLIGSTAVTSHAAVNTDARSIQISSQNIRIRC